MFTMIPDSDPRLHMVCDSVSPEELASEQFWTIFPDMFQFLQEQDGLGLAAPQIGFTKRFFVISHEGQRFACINPIIIERQGEWVYPEGCLSYPDQKVLVKRAVRIKISYLNQHGATKTHWLNGMKARIFQHELDHLNGIVIPDKR